MSFLLGKPRHCDDKRPTLYADLLQREPPFIVELAIACLGLPRRHHAVFRYGGNLDIAGVLSSADAFVLKGGVLHIGGSVAAASSFDMAGAGADLAMPATAADPPRNR